MAFMDDDELKQKLEDGGLISLPWRPKLLNLQEKGMITDDEYNIYKTRHEQHQSQQQKIIKERLQAKKNATSIEAVKCTDCIGPPINAGTYGYIFNTNDPNIVIKASMNAHSEAFGCPPDFTREIDAYHAISNSFNMYNRNIIKLVHLYGDLWVENRRCYYRMEKLFPIVLNTIQKTKLQESIAEETNKDIKYSLESLNDAPEMYMLTPGIINPIVHFSIAGGQYSNWREINMPVIEKFFDILDIDTNKYLEDLETILNDTLNNNIELIDVEFMLCSVITGINADDSPIKENKIVMIDFDKVKLNQDPPNKGVVMNQDMFVPESSKRVGRSTTPIKPKGGEEEEEEERKRGREEERGEREEQRKRSAGGRGEERKKGREMRKRGREEERKRGREDEEEEERRGKRKTRRSKKSNKRTRKTKKAKRKTRKYHRRK
jgi:hypothetical protein